MNGIFETDFSMLVTVAFSAVVCGALISVAITRLRRGRNRQSCQWVKAPVQEAAGSTSWFCIDCQANASTSDAKPPNECKSQYTSPLDDFETEARSILERSRQSILQLEAHKARGRGLEDNPGLQEMAQSNSDADPDNDRELPSAEPAKTMKSTDDQVIGQQPDRGLGEYLAEKKSIPTLADARADIEDNRVPYTKDHRRVNQGEQMPSRDAVPTLVLGNPIEERECPAQIAPEDKSSETTEKVSGALRETGIAENAAEKPVRAFPEEDNTKELHLVPFRHFDAETGPGTSSLTHRASGAEDSIPSLEPKPATEVPKFNRNLDHGRNVLATVEVVFEEEKLRLMVTEILRRELQGALAEQVSFMANELVRREIRRALATHKLG